MTLIKFCNSLIISAGTCFLVSSIFTSSPPIILSVLDKKTEYFSLTSSTHLPNSHVLIPLSVKNAEPSKAGVWLSPNTLNPTNFASCNSMCCIWPSGFLLTEYFILPESSSNECFLPIIFCATFPMLSPLPVNRTSSVTAHLEPSGSISNPNFAFSGTYPYINCVWLCPTKSSVASSQYPTTGVCGRDPKSLFENSSVNSRLSLVSPW